MRSKITQIGARRSGWTLVEVLLATVVGGAVVATASSVAVHLQRTRLMVQSSQRQRFEREYALELFEEDLKGRLRDIDGRTVEAPYNPGELLRVFGLVDAPVADSPFPRRLPAQILYRIEGDSTGKRLVRELRYISDPPDALRRETVGSRLESASVEFLVDDEWKQAETSRPTQAPIRAVRLSCAWGTGSDQRRRTVLLDEVGPKMPKARQ